MSFSTFTFEIFVAICILPSYTCITTISSCQMTILWASTLPYFCDSCIGGPKVDMIFCLDLWRAKSAGRITGLHATISASFQFTCQKNPLYRPGRFAGRASKPAGAQTGQNNYKVEHFYRVSLLISIFVRTSAQ